MQPPKDKSLIFVFLFFQTILEIKVLHRGYTDPNNLKFTEIKVLGVTSEVQEVMVLQNGEAIQSHRGFSYNSQNQVNRWFMGKSYLCN